MHNLQTRKLSGVYGAVTQELKDNYFKGLRLLKPFFIMQKEIIVIFSLCENYSTPFGHSGILFALKTD